MTELVLDASAVIALIKREPGADVVSAYIPGATMSAINVAEVATHLAESGLPADRVRAAIGKLGLDVAPCELDDAVAIGLLRPATREHGLSLGDRACLALGSARDMPVLTADRAWGKLDIGVEVRLLR